MDNRIIKFRALYEGVWYYQTLEEMLTITLAAFRLGKHKTQFTGLKDKEGNDIYEGDYGENYEVVKWCDNKNGWALAIYDFPTKTFINCHCYNCEGDFEINEIVDNMVVSGNIYQTPELLK